MVKRKMQLSTKQGLKGFLFTLPFVIGFILFFLTPLIRSLFFSFSSVTVDNEIGMVMKSVGLLNFKNALMVDPTFLKTLAASLQTLLINGTSILIYSFIVASILNQKFKGRTLARVVFFLPVIITSGIIYMLQNDAVMSSANQMISGSSGTEGGIGTLDLTGSILKVLPIDSMGLVSLIKSSVDRIYDITVSSGVQIIIFLAGFQNISSALYEASSIEGASAWENFWKITLPMVSPLILVNCVYTIIDSFNGLSNPIISTIYRVAFSSSDYGLSSAMSWVYILVIAVVLTVAIAAINRLVFYEN